jgi:two-component system cell cycle response regulator
MAYKSNYNFHCFKQFTRNVGETPRFNMAENQVTRVLVVDDAQVMRRAVEKMLHPDCEVVLANDGEAGWEVLTQDGHIQMLITDIQMPKLDGYGLICRVRADARSHIRDLPIITITGAEDDETRIRAYACGSTDFIIKPFDKKLLQSRVHAYLRLKRASLLHADADAGRDTDPLTKVKGLGAFLEAGKELFTQMHQKAEDLSVAALDIDDFETLRRQHGQAIADRLLVQVAEIITSTARREDVAARVGDAEFAVLIPQADRGQAMGLCELLRERIAATPLAAPSGSVPVTASFGLVTLSADVPETFEKFLVLVEQRLSQARSDGGNRVGVTLLSDVMPEPEEVVLTGVSDTMSDDAVELLDDPGDLSVLELEALVREEATRRKAGVPPRS